jgi:hypothetical protein
MSWNLEIYRRTSQKTNKKMPLDERLLCAYAYACAEVFLSFGFPFANVVSALLMCTTLSDLFVSLGDVGSVPSVSNLFIQPISVNWSCVNINCAVRCFGRTRVYVAAKVSSTATGWPARGYGHVHHVRNFAGFRFAGCADGWRGPRFHR